MNEFEKAPKAMLRSRAGGAETFRARVEAKLGMAEIPKALFVPREEGANLCTQGGYRICEYGAEYALIGVLGRDEVGEATQRAERDDLMQQVRDGLRVESGDWFDVSEEDPDHLCATESTSRSTLHGWDALGAVTSKECAYEAVINIEGGT